MDSYFPVLVGLGLLILLVAWLPLLLKNLPLSLPIVCVGIGFLLFRYGFPADQPHPLRYPDLTERLTELLVIVALTGCGLKLDREPGWRRWSATWRLLGLVMPLSIAGVTLLGWGVAGLGLPAALLLAAALAPTDPVLASDVQVGPPGSGEEDEVRFGLTSEAGLNDGLAFPFVNLALTLALAHGVAVPQRAEPEPAAGWFGPWLLTDVGWKLLAGAAIGWAVGLALGWATFRLPHPAKISSGGDGFVALAMTLLAYGLTELAHGYGFLAVFLAAVAFRRQERDHDYHTELHDYAEQSERLLMMIVLVLFGGAVGHGLLAGLTWGGVAVGLLLIFLVRPATAWIGFLGAKRPWEEVATLGFYGIRGVGSLYYVAWALNEADWGRDAEMIWSTVAFAVLVSVLLHGITVTPVMRLLDRHRQRRQKRGEAV